MNKEDKVNHEAVNEAVKDRLKAELMEIIRNEGLSLPQLLKNINIKRATAQRDMKMLKDVGFIHFAGAPKTGKYMITKDFAQVLNRS